MRRRCRERSGGSVPGLTKAPVLVPYMNTIFDPCHGATKTASCSPSWSKSADAVLALSRLADPIWPVW